MNEEFSMFLERFGPGVCYQTPPDDFFDKYKDVLPDGLLGFWREQGWRSYANGLLWTVNPEEYDWLVEGWVKSHEAMTKAQYFVFARTAFGEFYCLSPDARRVLTISCPQALLYASKAFFKSDRNADMAIESFFANAEREAFDYVDQNDKGLFARTFKRLGPLAADEVYGFVPLLTLGGVAIQENLEKLRMDVHIDILKQSSEIELQVI